MVVLAHFAANRIGVVEWRAVVRLQVQSRLPHFGRVENAHVAGQCVVGRKIRLSGEEIAEVGGGGIELVEKPR